MNLNDRGGLFGGVPGRGGAEGLGSDGAGRGGGTTVALWSGSTGRGCHSCGAERGAGRRRGAGERKVARRGMELKARRWIQIAGPSIWSA